MSDVRDHNGVAHLRSVARVTGDVGGEIFVDIAAGLDRECEEVEALYEELEVVIPARCGGFGGVTRCTVRCLVLRHLAEKAAA
jgi:hypothetical protein